MDNTVLKKMKKFILNQMIYGQSLLENYYHPELVKNHCIW